MNDLDYERWRGAVDEKLRALKDGQDRIPAHIDRWGDRLEDALRAHVDDDQNVETQLSTRISSLELKQSRLLGQLVIFGAISSAVLAAAATAVAKYVVP
jgi:hypothetical protein